MLSNGAYQTLDHPNAKTTLLNDINGSGVISGTYRTSSGDVFGFIYANGTFKDIKAQGYQSSTVEGINGYGYVTGIAYGPETTAFTAHCQ